MTMNINELLSMALARGASDLHLKVGAPPAFRIDGELAAPDGAAIEEQEMKAIFEEVADEAQRQAFAGDLEADFAYQTADTGRFRVNVCRQGGTLAMTFRPVRTDGPTLEELGLPAVCQELALKPSGLVIVTGPTGSGKSTTLAAMMDYLNQTTRQKIVTIEDPVEFVHRDRQCIFSQREVGRDTRSFASALKYSLRQDPDVILVGEMRDLETMTAALTAAETGHLVLTTLHTRGTAEAIDRVSDVFTPHQQPQVRLQLAITLEGVLYQLLLPRADSPGRIAAVEVMLATPAIRALIREGKTHQMRNVIQTGTKYGMQTLNQSLAELCQRGLIRREDALARSHEPAELAEIIGA
jgi:twitching motility protein PilT